MTITVPAPVEKLTARLHRWLYRRTGGTFGGTVGRTKRPVGLLTTTGRRSGEPREWPLLCLADGDRHVVVASNAGRDHHPVWLLNLRANPRATLQIGPDRLDVLAREATPTEADELWPRLHAMYNGYADCQAGTDRDLPVVILESTINPDRPSHNPASPSVE